ncbi:hypothetical protein [Acinetobacter tjernbergiae]|jgi:predicted nuclease with TOPRIM domain|uniref:Uncharacterized protein n=1 Tax=Acinetobacter tjernbergiae DSM 14971 = CIP 107465 TaxID=1120928 RepID=V2V5L2_9GAMM|nr:hypothetical protein [Acinetobacter tjernbergiae]ESK57557.1 hypothetical protein F990_00093 [Acinetobacter tjernbergiae DSM 14971 = CIP 107465]
MSLMFPRNEVDKKISTLNKQATQYSHNDWDNAIKCLEEVWLLMPNAMMDYGAQSLVRLPKFLQQAGRFSEAKERFNELINSVDEYAERVSKTHDLKEFYKPTVKHSYLAEVYDAMRIAYKREKLIDQSNQFEKLSKEHYGLSEEQGKKLQEARKKQLEEHKNWMRQMGEKK